MIEHIIISLSEGLVHVQCDRALKVEVRDYDWPIEGDVDHLPDDHVLVDNSEGLFVRYWVDA